MKLLSTILLLLAVFGIARAEPADERWDAIPTVSSLEIEGDSTVALRSEHNYMDHLLANGHLYGGAINAETGEIIATTDNGTHRTLKVGEAVCWSGVSDHIIYKLVSIHDGSCVFECSGWDRAHRKFKKTFTIAPYPKA